MPVGNLHVCSRHVTGEIQAPPVVERGGVGVAVEFLVPVNGTGRHAAVTGGGLGGNSHRGHVKIRSDCLAAAVELHFTQGNHLVSARIIGPVFESDPDRFAFRARREEQGEFRGQPGIRQHFAENRHALRIEHPKHEPVEPFRVVRAAIPDFDHVQVVVLRKVHHPGVVQGREVCLAVGAGDSIQSLCGLTPRQIGGRLKDSDLPRKGGGQVYAGISAGLGLQSGLGHCKKD